MGVSPAWRMFRRMQFTAFAVGALIYAAGAVHAWRVLPAAPKLKLEAMALWPAIYFATTLIIPLLAPPIRHLLKTHIWISFRTGFGQSVVSVLAVVLVLGVAAAFIYTDIGRAAHGGRFPQASFAAYAAGLGVLLAQACLVRMIERDPLLRPRIENPA
jgi:hypothetical protein